jgi:hypothetical protein
MKTLGLVILLLGVLLGITASAEKPAPNNPNDYLYVGTTGDLARQCHGYRFERGFVMGYVTAVYAELPEVADTGNRTQQEITDAVCSYVAGHPEMSATPRNKGVHVALSALYGGGK